VSGRIGIIYYYVLDATQHLKNSAAPYGLWEKATVGPLKSKGSRWVLSEYSRRSMEQMLVRSSNLVGSTLLSQASRSTLIKLWGNRSLT
jgi:hypothetical protein